MVKPVVLFTNFTNCLGTLRDIRDGKSKSAAIAPVGGEMAWKMSVYDRNDAMAITPDGLRCQSREFKEWHGCRATAGVRNRGKYYFEAIVCDEGLCRVGWSTQSATLDLGTDRFGFGFGGTGKNRIIANSTTMVKHSVKMMLSHVDWIWNAWRSHFLKMAQIWALHFASMIIYAMKHFIRLLC